MTYPSDQAVAAAARTLCHHATPDGGPCLWCLGQAQQALDVALAIDYGGLAPAEIVSRAMAVAAATAAPSSPVHHAYAAGAVFLAQGLWEVVRQEHRVSAHMATAAIAARALIDTPGGSAALAAIQSWIDQEAQR